MLSLITTSREDSTVCSAQPHSRCGCPLRTWGFPALVAGLVLHRSRFNKGLPSLWRALFLWSLAHQS